MLLLFISNLLTATSATQLFAIQDPSSLNTSYSQISCTANPSSVCCNLREYFIYQHWTDITLNSSCYVTTNCFLDSTGTQEWIHVTSCGTPNHPYSSPASVITQNWDCKDILFVKLLLTLSYCLRFNPLKSSSRFK